MRSLVVERPGPSAIRERDLPVPSVGDICIRVERAGITAAAFDAFEHDRVGCSEVPFVF